MKLSRKSITILFVAILLAAFATACRTRTKVQPRTTPPPPEVVDTAPEVSAPSTPVETTTDDFVTDKPGVDAEDLPSDTTELTRIAQERGWIRDAFFDYDASTLSSDAQEALTTSATWLKAHPQYNLLIEGHCDERGTQQYNLALGDKRANTAREYLVTLGVDSGRVRTVSYGEERPFETGSNESAWAKNRRAHLVITGR
jgi:peptidoglycan-associated lipoprotein